MTADPAAGATDPPAAPRWWAPLAALVTATFIACALFVVANRIRPELFWYRYVGWLLTVVVVLGPCAWLWQRAATSRTVGQYAASRLRRALVATVLAVGGVFSALAIAFAVFLWRGQVAYSEVHDPTDVPPGAATVHVAGLASLAASSAEQHDRLRLYLARDYRWLVTTWDGTRVAFLRGGAPGRRQHGSNGYQRTKADGTGVQYRLGVYLDRATAMPGRRPVDVVAAGTPSTPVRLLKNPHGSGAYASTLWIEGTRGAVEVIEDSGEPARVQSNALVAALGEELAAVFAAPGHAAVDDLLESGSIAGADVPTLSVDVHADGADDPVGHGVYLVSGAINRGEEGSVTVRAFGPSNQPLRVTSLPVAREYVGWSSDATRRYRYGFEILVEDPDEREQLAARFELWFTPMNGGAERRLGSVERVIRGYRS